MPRVQITSGWWDEPTGDGYVRHSRGDIVDVSPAESGRLTRAGAATEVAEPKPRQRRGKSDDEE